VTRTDELRFGTRFALASLATWRVTHLLTAEDGPGDVLVRLRARLGESLLGTAMDCFNCTSIWVAVPFTRAVTRSGRSAPPVWLALSGAACLLERTTGGEGHGAAILELGEVTAGTLREEAKENDCKAVMRP
jgi:hypothetical protein